VALRAKSRGARLVSPCCTAWNFSPYAAYCLTKDAADVILARGVAATMLPATFGLYSWDVCVDVDEVRASIGGPRLTLRASTGAVGEKGVSPMLGAIAVSRAC